MGKDNFFTGQPVFNQLLQLIPKHILRDVIKCHESDRYYKKFKTYDHLVTMLYTCFHGCKSLREVTTGIMACTTRINQELIICHAEAPSPKQMQIGKNKCLAICIIAYMVIFIRTAD